MNICGIICEYNPFHNGHLYQINKTRQLRATHIVGIMSGNIVQRGDISIIDKHIRAQNAVKNGIDLVIELPVPYSVSSAEIFAKSSVYILNKLNVVDLLSFGSESGELKKIKIASEISIKYKNSKDVLEYIKNGLSYPLAMSKAIEKDFGKEIADIFNSPNNTLAIEYLNALNSINSRIKPITVKRNSIDHDSDIETENFASASLLRTKIANNENIDKFIPKNLNQETQNIANIKNIEKIIFYKLLSMSKEKLNLLPDANGGLGDRLYSAINSSLSYNDLLMKCKTKCFTLARIRRVIMYALLGVTYEDLNILPQYARILAFNEKGQEILSEIKKRSDFPISTSLSKLSKISNEANRLSELDNNASNLFSLACDNNNYRKNEYSVKVTKTI